MYRFPKPMRVTLILMVVYASMFPSAIYSQQLNCHSHLTASVGGACELDLTADQLITGSYDLSALSVIYKKNGVPVDLMDGQPYIGQTLTFEVHDMSTSNFCWGTIAIEDKIVPSINCGPCTDLNNLDTTCMLRCPSYDLFSERDKITGVVGYATELLDKILPSDPDNFIQHYVTDNCDQEVTASYHDAFVDGDVCGENSLMIRTWTISYQTPHGTEQQVCTQYYEFVPMDFYDLSGSPIIMEGDGTPIENHILLPKQFVTIPQCDAGIKPSDIAAYFDDPQTLDEDSNGNGQTEPDCVIENNEGICYAYPHYYMPGLGVCPTPGPGEGGGTGSGTGSGSMGGTGSGTGSGTMGGGSGLVGTYPLHPQPITSKVCNLNVFYADNIIEACAPECGGNVKVARQWTIMNWCNGETFEYMQNIEIYDAIGPEMLVHDFIQSVDPWQCAADVQVPVPEHLKDNCGGDVEYNVGIVGQPNQITGNTVDGYVIHAVPPGIYTINYTAEDCCGNKTKISVQMQVRDATPPVPVTIENIVVDMTFVDDLGLAKIYADDVDNGSYDACGPVNIYVKRAYANCSPQDTVWGDYVTFCCEDLKTAEFVLIDVQFKVEDWLGNENLLWSTIRLEDKGSVVACPPDMVLACTEDYHNFDNTGGVPVLYRACEQLVLPVDTLDVYDNTQPRQKNSNQGAVPGYIGVAVPEYNPACGFGAVRKVFDQCTQWLVIEPIADVFDASTIVFPQDTIIDCTDGDTGEPTWHDAICNLVGFSLVSDTFLLEEDACATIINEWTVIDWCNHNLITGEGEYTFTQIVRVDDNTIPTLVVDKEQYFAVNADCHGKGVALKAIAQDSGECASPWLGWKVEVDIYDDLQIDYVYSTNAPATLPNGEPNPLKLTKTKSGGQQLINLPDDIVGSKVPHRIIWSVDDGCRNTQQNITYFFIEDQKAPTPYCLNLSTAVMTNGEVELWAIDFDQNSFDNCYGSDQLTFTFTDVPPPPQCNDEYDSNADLQWYDTSYWFYDASTIYKEEQACGVQGAGEYMDLDDYGGDVHRWEPGLRSSGKIFTIDDMDVSNNIMIPIYVWDGCQNVDFCTVNLQILNNGGGTSNIISGKVTTETNQVVEGIMTTLMTDMPEYPKTQMTDSQGGFLFVDNHMAMDYAVSGYSDDNYTNGVSTLDLVMIQRHILNLEPLRSPYKMIAADVNNDKRINGLDLVELRKLILGIYQELPENHSWITVAGDQHLDISNPWNYRNARYLNDLSDSQMEEDFIGVKIGDVNDDVIANSQDQSTPAGLSISLTYADVELAAGESVEVDFDLTQPMSACQMELDFQGLEVMSVGGLESEEFVADAHSLRVSKSSLIEADKIFSVTLRAESNTRLSDHIELNNNFLIGEAYGLDEQSTFTLNLTASLEEDGLRLLQNSPNPFSQYTFVKYELDEASDVKITLFDAKGILLREIEADGYEGMNMLKVNRENLEPGLIFCKIESKGVSLVKEMIVLD